MFCKDFRNKNIIINFLKKCLVIITIYWQGISSIIWIICRLSNVTDYKLQDKVYRYSLDILYGLIIKITMRMPLYYTLILLVELRCQ